MAEKKRRNGLNFKVKKLVEHSIRTWAKSNGTWDVTHHKSQPNSGYLHDVQKNFRNFKTRKEAEEYAFKLFTKRLRKGNHVELKSPDSFGQETASSCWTSFNGDGWMVRIEEDAKVFFWSSPNLADNTLKVPQFVLDYFNGKLEGTEYFMGKITKAGYLRKLRK